MKESMLSSDVQDRRGASRLRIRLETDRMLGVDFARRPRARGASAGPAADPLSALAADVAACSGCALSETRTNVVFGEGSASPVVMFVGEAPGAEEDRRGRPFVGRAGALLDKIIGAMGLTREDVFIGNVLKCRPPGNRDPQPAETAACLPFLKKQIALLRPRMIVALGAHAARALGAPSASIQKSRGKVFDFEGVAVMPTFHPAYLLRNAGEKRKVWEDMKKVLAALGRTPPPRARSGGKTA
jgi:DNA polymerase